MESLPSTQQHAPSGPDGSAEKTVAPSGPGATSEADAATEARAAEEAGGVIPADDTERLREPS